MHPYRDRQHLPRAAAEADPDELWTYGLLVVIGAVPLLIALVRGGRFGGEATLGMLMVAAGVVGAVYRTRATR